VGGTGDDRLTVGEHVLHTPELLLVGGPAERGHHFDPEEEQS